MQEAEVTHPSITTRQHMDHQPPQELDQRQCPLPLLPGPVVLIAEGDCLCARIVGRDLLLGDDSTVEITREVLERWQAVTDVLALHNPVRRTLRRQFETGVFEPLDEPRTEDLRDGTDVEQVSATERAPSMATIHPGTGHDHMQVRMVVDLSVMGMQHRNRSCREVCFKLGMTLSEAAQCLDGGTEQQVIDRMRLPTRQSTQC